MASKTLQVIITGDVKGAVTSFAELDAAAGTTNDSIASKFGALGSVIGVGVAAGVVAAGVALYKIGETFDEQYDKIRAGTGATGKALEGLKDDFKQVVQDVPTDFNSAGDAITQINQKLGLTGKPLQEISERFLEVSRVTKTDLTANLKAGGDALNQFGIVGKDQKTVLDEMFRAAQASGLSFTDVAGRVAAAGTVLRAAGLDVRETTAFVASLGKAGIDVGDVMPAFSRALATAAKDGKDAGQLISETFDAIKNAPDDTAAAGIALEVFGAKAGPKFAQLIREGKLSYEDMLGTIAFGKDTIMKAGHDTEDFHEKWQKLKNTLMVAIEPAATKVFSAVGDGMQWVLDHKEDFQQAFEDIGHVIKRAMQVAGPVMKGFVDQIMGFANLIDDVIHGRWGEIWHDFVNILKNAFAPIKGFIQGVADLFGVDLGNMLEGAKEKLAPVLDGIGGAMRAIGEAAKWVWDRVQEAWPTVQSILEGVWSVVQGGLQTFGGIVKTIGEAAKWVWDRFQEAWPIVQGIIETVWGVVGGILGTFAAVVNAIGGAAQWVMERSQEAWPVVQDAIKTAWDIVQVPLGLMRDVLGGIADAVGWIKDRSADAWGGFQSGVTSMWDAVDGPLHSLKSVLDGIVSAAKSVKRAIEDIPDPPSGGGGLLNPINYVPGGTLINRALGKAGGGLVSATPGGVLHLLGEGGDDEVVLNSSQATRALWNMANARPSAAASGGGNSYTINVTVGPGGNPAETGRAIVEMIRAYENRSGASWRAA